MKKIIILTLFDKPIQQLLNFSIIKNAIAKKIIEIKIINFRDYSKNKHKKVDDYQYGGGPGMVLTLQPIVDAIKKNKKKNMEVILLSPQGKKYDQKMANKFAKSKKNLMLVCGHYEGFDARIINFVDRVISIGDYVLTGGELPACIVVDSIVRLLDSCITKKSLLNESFNEKLLDYDCYTKPKNFYGYKVPQVLLSGNHKLIEEFRRKNRLKKTKQLRPDLLKK
jgi:tRNA (guanine37-N1)-methyltransferase